MLTSSAFALGKFRVRDLRFASNRAGSGSSSRSPRTKRTPFGPLRTCERVREREREREIDGVRAHVLAVAFGTAVFVKGATC